MGKRPSRRIGAQLPRLSLIPAEVDFAAGDEVIEFAARFGLMLDDWQQWVVRHMCSERQAGGWSASTALLLVPRQSGKSAILEAIELAAMFLWDEQHVIYSAHLGKTATDHMRRIRRHVDANPSLRRACRVLTGKGDERLEMNKSGAILEFITRGKKTARGGSPSRVIFDEAMYLTNDQVAAMVPALSAQSMSLSAQAQMIYASSAPVAESEVLHRLRRKALSGSPDDRLFYAEWSVDMDADPADRANWYAANPGLGIRISEEWVASNEFGVMSPIDFATERLGVPQGGEDTGDGPLDVNRWAQLADGESMATDATLRLALDAPIDRSSACFVVAGRREDRLRHVAIRYWLNGARLHELPAIARQLCDGHGVKLHVPPKSPALAWRDDLRDAGVEVVEVKAAAFAEAQQTIEQAVAEGTLRHRGQPEMVTAVAGLAARVAGDLSPWSRRSSSSNVAPLFAAAAAVAAAGDTDTDTPSEAIALVL